MLLKGAISSNNNPQGHDDGGHPDVKEFVLMEKDVA